MGSSPPERLLFRVAAEECDAKAAGDRLQREHQYNDSAHTLAPLKVGSNVRLQDPVSKRWDKVGVIVGIGYKRDYHVKLPSGRVLWRNRRFLRVSHTSSSADGSPADEEEDSESAIRVPERRVRFQLPSTPLRCSSRQRRVPDRLGYNN